jgi:hypothetical protein
MKFTTQAAAEAEAGKLSRKRDTTFWAYKCKFCHFYHLGHKPRRFIGERI